MTCRISVLCYENDMRRAHGDWFPIKWEQVGMEHPKYSRAFGYNGLEITHTGLANALKDKTEFTREAHILKCTLYRGFLRSMAFYGQYTDTYMYIHTHIVCFEGEKKAQKFSPPPAGETPDPCHLSGPDMISYTFRHHTPSDTKHLGLPGGAAGAMDI